MSCSRGRLPLKGILTIVGGFIVHLTLGTQLTYGKSLCFLCLLSFMGSAVWLISFVFIHSSFCFIHSFSLPVCLSLFQSQKGSNERLFILTRTRSMQIFGEIPFITFFFSLFFLSFHIFIHSFIHSATLPSCLPFGFVCLFVRLFIHSVCWPVCLIFVFAISNNPHAD